MRTSGDITGEFLINFKSIFVCTVVQVMDKLIRSIHNEVSWCMLFANNMILVDETRHGVMPN